MSSEFQEETKNQRKVVRNKFILDEAEEDDEEEIPIEDRVDWTNSDDDEWEEQQKQERARLDEEFTALSQVRQRPDTRIEASGDSWTPSIFRNLINGIEDRFASSSAPLRPPHSSANASPSSPAPASPAFASPTFASPTSASPTFASPTPSSPTFTSPTLGSPQPSFSRSSTPSASPEFESETPSKPRRSRKRKTRSLPNSTLNTFYTQLRTLIYENPGPKFVSKFSLYHVRCLRGQEKRITNQIRNDIEERNPLLQVDSSEGNALGRIISDVFPSRMKGFIYLFAVPMSNDNHQLALYLKLVDGFCYSRKSGSRMPEHHIVTAVDAPLTSPISIGDWVTLKKGLYAGSVGLVGPYNQRLGQHVYTVYTIPRVPRNFEEEKSMVHSDFRPTSALFTFKDAVSVFTAYQLDGLTHWGEAIKPTLGECLHPDCPHGEDRLQGYSCAHLREFFFQEKIFQHGLVLIRCSAADVDPAPPTMDWSSYHSFLESLHPFVLSSILKMPTPSSWIFCTGENVKAIEPWGTPYCGPLLPLHLHGTVGTIHKVEDRTCEVMFAGQLWSLPNILLLKHFDVGAIVQVPDLEGIGTVVTLQDSCAVLLLSEETQKKAADKGGVVVRSLNILCSAPVSVPRSEGSPGGSLLQLAPESESSAQMRTRRCLWIGVPVIIVQKNHARRTYTGVVIDAQRNSMYRCGLGVRVRYDVVNIQVGEEWLDYEAVRNLNTLRFLHDGKPTGLDNYYQFNDGSTPSYTHAELIFLEKQDAIQRDKILYQKIKEADVKAREEEVRSLFVMPPPPPDHWILDPRWRSALGDLEFHIQVHHGKFASPKDQIVHLAFLFQHIEVRIRPKRLQKQNVEVIPPQNICDIPPGGVRTKEVSLHGYNARGLFLVTKADDEAHVGKLVRRVSDVDKDKNGYYLPDNNGLYLVQRVSVRPVPARSKYEEDIMPEEPFIVHYTGLLLVYMSTELNKRGNKLMYNIRKKYHGHVLDCDVPKENELSELEKRDNADKAEMAHLLKTAQKLPSDNHPSWSV